MEVPSPVPGSPVKTVRVPYLGGGVMQGSVCTIEICSPGALRNTLILSSNRTENSDERYWSKIPQTSYTLVGVGQLFFSVLQVSW